MEIRYEKSTISLNTNCFQILQHSWKLKVRESKYFGKGRKAARCFQSMEHILHNYVGNVYCGQGISKPHASESKGNITKSKCKFVARVHNWEFAETHPQARKWWIYCRMQNCWYNTYYWQQQTLTLEKNKQLTLWESALSCCSSSSFHKSGTWSSRSVDMNVFTKGANSRADRFFPIVLSHTYMKPKYDQSSLFFCLPSSSLLFNTHERLQQQSL